MWLMCAPTVHDSTNTIQVHTVLQPYICLPRWRIAGEYRFAIPPLVLSAQDPHAKPLTSFQNASQLSLNPRHTKISGSSTVSSLATPYRFHVRPANSHDRKRL